MILCDNVPDFNLTLKIRFDKIDWQKLKPQGFDFLMEIALADEEYEKAARIRDERRARGLEGVDTGYISLFEDNYKNHIDYDGCDH